MKSKHVILVIILGGLVVTPAVSATAIQSAKNPCLGEKKYIATESDGSVRLYTKYTVQFNEDEKQICIKRERSCVGDC